MTTTAPASTKHWHAQSIGDPTEGALRALAAKGGVDQESAAEHKPGPRRNPFVWCRRYFAAMPAILKLRPKRAGNPGLARYPRDMF